MEENKKINIEEFNNEIATRVEEMKKLENKAKELEEQKENHKKENEVYSKDEEMKLQKYEIPQQRYDEKIENTKEKLEEEINKSIEFVRSENDKIREIVALNENEVEEKISGLNKEKEKLQKELEELKEQEKALEFYADRYQEKGKEYHNILVAIGNKNIEISNIDKEIEVYNTKSDLEEQFKSNLKLIDNLEKMEFDKISETYKKEEKDNLTDMEREALEELTAEGFDINDQNDQRAFKERGLEKLIEEHQQKMAKEKEESTKTNKTNNVNKKEIANITIGRDGKIHYKDKEFKIDKKVIKDGIALYDLKTDVQMQTYFKQIIGEKLEENELKEIKDRMADGRIDMVVLNSIVKSNMSEDDKLDICKKYIQNSDGVEVTYNLEDLSKVSLFSRLFGNKELDEMDKLKLYHKANLAAQKTPGRVKKEGENIFNNRWNKGLKNAIVHLFRRNKYEMMTGLVEKENGEEVNIELPKNDWKEGITVKNVSNTKTKEQVSKQETKEEEIQEQDR